MNSQVKYTNISERNCTTVFNLFQTEIEYFLTHFEFSTKAETLEEKPMSLMNINVKIINRILANQI